MKFVGILTAAINPLTLVVKAAPPSTYGYFLEARLESRGSGPKTSGGSRPLWPAADSPDAHGLAKLKSINPGIVAETRYVFMLMVSPGGAYGHSEETKAYCAAGRLQTQGSYNRGDPGAEIQSPEMGS